MTFGWQKRCHNHRFQIVKIAYVGNAQPRLSQGHASGYGPGVRNKRHAPIQPGPQPCLFQRLAGIDAGRNVSGISENQRRIAESGKQRGRVIKINSRVIVGMPDQRQAVSEQLP